MQVLCCFAFYFEFNVPARHTVGNISASLEERSGLEREKFDNIVAI